MNSSLLSFLDSKTPFVRCITLCQLFLFHRDQPNLNPSMFRILFVCSRYSGKYVYAREDTSYKMFLSFWVCFLVGNMRFVSNGSLYGIQCMFTSSNFPLVVYGDSISRLRPIDTFFFCEMCVRKVHSSSPLFFSMEPPVYWAGQD